MLIGIIFYLVFKIHQVMENKQTSIINILAACADACYNCSMACLGEKDVPHLAHCIRLDLDCAQICQLTAAFISRQSERTKPLLLECVNLCRLCVTECSKHANMEHCKICAEMCKKCADACREYDDILAPVSIDL